MTGVRQVTRRVGRVALWLVVAWLVVRGAAGSLGPRAEVAAVRVPARVAAVWPDDGARAFAMQFAAALLGSPPADAPQVLAR